MRSEPDQNATNRRGCSVVVGIGALIVLLLVAIGLGWIGDTDRKITDFIVIEGG
jgi:hypothetical protein